MNNGLKLGVVLVGGVLAVACGPGARMLAPGDVAEKSQVLEVSGRSNASGAFVNEGFKLGNYEIAKVDRDWNSSSHVGVGGWGKDKKTTGYTFQLKSGAETWKGSCASLAQEQSVGSFSFGSSNEIVCECESGSQKVTLKLGGETQANSGTFTTGGKSYQVKEVKETDQSYYGQGPVGFRLDDGETPYAAVETLRPGRVWLDKQITEPEAASTSCVLAGTMLYMPPKDD